MYCNRPTTDGYGQIGICHFQNGHKGSCRANRVKPLPTSRPNENSSAISIRCCPSLKQPPAEHRAFVGFLQHLMDRRQLGYLRYEQKNKGPHRRQRYVSRMIKEVEAYIKSGNAEQLYNIAMYCYLETRAPENDKFHFDNQAESVTRGKFKGDESIA